MSETAVDHVDHAALAIEQVISPSMTGLIAHVHGTQPVREIIEGRMRHVGGYAATWLAAHSSTVCAAVSLMTPMSEQDASYFVGAAAYALLAANRDVTEASVRDLARLAVVWHLGAEYARAQARASPVGV